MATDVLEETRGPQSHCPPHMAIAIAITGRSATTVVVGTDPVAIAVMVVALGATHVASLPTVVCPSLLLLCSLCHGRCSDPPYPPCSGVAFVFTSWPAGTFTKLVSHLSLAALIV